MERENHKDEAFIAPEEFDNLHDKLVVLAEACAPVLCDRRLFFVMAIVSLFGCVYSVFTGDLIEAVLCGLISLVWMSAYIVRKTWNKAT